MIELPEAQVLAEQMQQTLNAKIVSRGKTA